MSIDYTKSMFQTFEYYEVDPGTWRDKRRLNNVLSSTISRDSEAETKGSAAFDVTGSIGECYIRVYLVANQNGVSYKKPLGTYLVQTPSSSFDGRVRSVSMDAYTPLMELKENPPPLGYSLLEGEEYMDRAYQLIREHARAPVSKVSNNDKLTGPFVANTDDTWLSFVADLVSVGNYSLELDELGRIQFSPYQKLDAMQPKWDFTDDNSSILLPDIEMTHDLWGIPNVVEVIYSGTKNTIYGKAVNDDPNSLTSTITRGRVITKRITNPEFGGLPSQGLVDRYAANQLEKESTVEYKVTYSHAYCDVRVGDCVRLNYKRAGITNIKAKIISQKFNCEPGMTVTETAIFTTKLWEA